MPRMIHFEVGADDLGRAAQFYCDVFDWDIQKWEGPMEYWLITTGSHDQPGINGALMKREFANTANAAGVDSVGAYVEKIAADIGEAVTPKMAVPVVGYFTYCRDTEGNIFGIMEENSSAK